MFKEKIAKKLVATTSDTIKEELKSYIPIALKFLPALLAIGVMMISCKKPPVTTSTTPITINVYGGIVR